jgi:thiol:disulfide interchange protein
LLLLLTAALGGMLLNFTPCVLPLIPIKIISLSHAAKDRRQCFMLGLAMFLGVLVFWLLLGAMIALVSDFSATNQLFQYPVFTISVGLIIGVMATGMFGFFSMRLPNFIYMINPEQNTLHGSFGLGNSCGDSVDTLHRTLYGCRGCLGFDPSSGNHAGHLCRHRYRNGPPLPGAFGVTGLVRKMPKTGPASALIKQVMGLCMLAAAAYFTGVGLVSLFSAPPAPPKQNILVAGDVF